MNAYQQISIHINKYRYISTDIFNYKQISTNIFKYEQIWMHISKYQQISIHITKIATYHITLTPTQKEGTEGINSGTRNFIVFCSWSRAFFFQTMWNSCPAHGAHYLPLAPIQNPRSKKIYQNDEKQAKNEPKGDQFFKK